MIVKSLDIPFDGNGMTIDFRKEDGLPRIDFNSNGSSFSIGTHEQFTPEILRQMADALNELASAIDSNYDFKPFVVSYLKKNSMGVYHKFSLRDNNGEYESTKDLYESTRFSIKDAFEVIKRLKLESPKLYAEVTFYNQKTTDTPYPIGQFKSSIIHTSLPIEFMKFYNIYDGAIEEIKKYARARGKDWSFILQSTSNTFYVEL